MWESDGGRDLAQWLSGRIGISNWAARRWINAARALPHLPHICAAFEAGTLCLDKVVELCRFATPKDEHRLISWARRVTVWTVRRRADVANRPVLEDAVEADATRFLRYWWFDDGHRLGLEGSLPADQGAVVAKALDRMAGRMPTAVVDGCDGGCDGACSCAKQSFEDSLEARRADALAVMASRAIADDGDADRATVVVHAGLDALAGNGGCEIEDGPVIHAETAAARM